MKLQIDVLQYKDIPMATKKLHNLLHDLGIITLHYRSHPVRGWNTNITDEDRAHGTYNMTK